MLVADITIEIIQKIMLFWENEQNIYVNFGVHGPSIGLYFQLLSFSLLHVRQSLNMKSCELLVFFSICISCCC